MRQPSKGHRIRALASQARQLAPTPELRAQWQQMDRKLEYAQSGATVQQQLSAFQQASLDRKISILEDLLPVIVRGIEVAPSRDAAESFQQLQRQFNTALLAMRGWSRRQTGDNAGAMSCFGQALAANPDDFVALWGRGAVRATCHDRPGALADLERAATLAMEQSCGDVYVRIRDDIHAIQLGKKIGDFLGDALPKLALRSLGL